MKLTNCLNCGAPLHGSKCDYCGTEYDRKEDKPMSLELSEESTHGVFHFNGMDFDVKLTNCDVEYPTVEVTRCRDDYRTFIPGLPTSDPKVTFTLEGYPRRAN